MSIIYGTAGSDILIGSSENDDLRGEAGNDSLAGGDGDDYLEGGTGNDTLDGGTGYDRLFGGSGDDTYIINSKTFLLYEKNTDGNNDSAVVNVDFVKIPSYIENVTFAEGVQQLPYWIDALLGDMAASFSSLLGTEKTFSFGFPQVEPSYYTKPIQTDGWEPFNNSQKAFTHSALEYIASVIDITFTEVTDVEQQNTLSFANNSQDGFAGMAYLPSPNLIASDVFIDKENDGVTKTAVLSPQEGTYQALTWIHEIGHALGLKHPHQEKYFLPTSEDKTSLSVMSYTQPVDKDNGDPLLTFSILDIAALHYLYGPNPSSRAGDDTYVYKSNDANFIWDGAGTDTINAGYATEKVTIYLEPGYWGFGGDAKATTITSNGQITVNFGTVIENLIGSGYDDKLVGNSVDNSIDGGPGDDSIYGGTGNDRLDYTYPQGDDTLYGGKGNDLYFIYSSGGSDTIIEYEGEGYDRVYTAISFSLGEIANVEDLFSFSNTTDDLTLTGNSLNNNIGPSSGNCTIDGGAGTDTAYYYTTWAKDDCTIFKSGGLLKVTKGNGNTDTLINCEEIKFSDQTVTISQLTFGLVVSEFTPAQNATGVAVAADITVTFSEAIKRGTGDITLKTDSGVVVATYSAADSANLSISGNTLTINPTADLSSDTTYQVVIATGSITDLSGNDYEQTSDYKFTTADTIDPTVSSFIPTDDATSVAVAADITVTFSEAIKRGTGDITLKTDSGVVVATYSAADSTNLSISGNTLTINPSADLSSDTTYQVVIAAGSITDLSGNDYEQTSDYKFTTADIIDPTVSSFIPTNDATGVAVAADITVTFSEAIKRGTGDITLKTDSGVVVATYSAADSTNLSISGNTLTINPSADLSSDTTYQVVFAAGSITDLSGNDYEQTSDYKFTTADTIDPTVSSFIPTDDATGVAVAADITVTFSEAIKRGTGDITLKTDSGVVVATYSASDSTNLSISGNTLTINPSADLSSDTTYQVVIAAGSITDLSGNEYEQTSDYKFTTADIIDPTANSFIPTDDATGVAVATDITVTFSEVIKRGTGDITLKSDSGVVVATYSAADSTKPLNFWQHAYHQSFR